LNGAPPNLEVLGGSAPEPPEFNALGLQSEIEEPSQMGKEKGDE